MRAPRPRLALVVLLSGASALLAAPAFALAHGEEEEGKAPEAKIEMQEKEKGRELTPEEREMAAEEAEVAALAEQPARVLAQQALAMLEVRGDEHEAGMRLDAALESKDKSDVDLATLRQAMETLDGGDPQGAVPLLDRALSRPLGSESGKALHEAERSIEPAKTAQDVVGVVAGAVLLLLAAVGLWRARPRPTTP